MPNDNPDDTERNGESSEQPTESGDEQSNPQRSDREQTNREEWFAQDMRDQPNARLWFERERRAREDRTSVAEAVEIARPGVDRFHVRGEPDAEPRYFAEVQIDGVRVSLDPGSSATLVPADPEERLRVRFLGARHSPRDHRECRIETSEG